MMKMRKLLIGSLFLLFVFRLNSQSNNSPGQRLEDLKTVIPPSPNAASVGKYAEWPVSLYTGTPQISIPVYQLNGRSVSVPISINYHASGIKVAEVASWVGLGWTLNAGGVITRSVKGLPDEFQNEIGYLSLRQLYLNPGNLASGTGNINTDIQHKIDIADGKRDSEPDFFTLNALGRHYKLLFKGDGTITTVPYSKVKITVDFMTDSWIVILEDGTNLLFGVNFVDKITANRNWHPDVPRDPFGTAWHLKKITTSEGEIIDFNYSGYTLHQSNTFFEEDQFFNNAPYGVVSCAVGSECVIPAATPTAKTTNFQQNGTGFNLASIENDECRVEFQSSASERLDFQFGKSLSAIKVYSKSANQYIKTVNFLYTYSSAAAGNSVGTNIYHTKRLKLNEMSETDAVNSTIRKWQFQYNPLSLPSVKSFAQDHWGYYNGATGNTTLLPQIFSNKYVVQRGFDPDNVKVGNREPSAQHMQAEMLSRITYPTGGYSNFEFEPNSYPANEEVFQNQSISKNVYLTASANPFINTQSVQFTVTKEQYVYCTFNGVFSASYLSGYGVNTILARCKIFNSANVLFGSIVFTKSDVEASGSGIKTAWFYVPPGTYTMEVSSIAIQNELAESDIIDLRGQLNYQQSAGVQQVNKMTGGLRIKKIEDFDAVSNSLAPRIFQYDQPYIIHPFQYDEFYLSDRESELDRYYQPDPVPSPCYINSGAYCYPSSNCYQKYLVRSSAPKSELGDLSGATAGYGIVRELKGSNGYTVNEFLNVADENISNATEFPYPVVNSKAWQRGQLLSEKIYNASGQIVSKTENQYELLPLPPSVSAFKTGWAKVKLRLIIHCFNAGELASNLQTRDIFIASGLIRPVAVTKTEYMGGTATMATTTNYYYDNPVNLQSTRQETVNSKGEIIKTITRTPLEKSEINAATPLTPAESAAIDAMVAGNNITPVLQTESYNNSTLLARTHVTYKNWNGSLVKPEYGKLQIKNNPIETKIKIKGYDNYGNILEQQTQDNITESFIWGYGNRYLVAKIVNKSYNDIINMSGINLAIINNPQVTDAVMRQELNKLRSVANCFVTTYTYKPLTGITSETDPNGRTIYYEYDHFSRVSLIRDKDNNILKKFCYNYAGQPENCNSPCTNTTANWQNTTTPPTCQQGSCGNNGYQLQEQRDMNACSPTYNQTQTVLVYNPAACTSAAGVNITYQNFTGQAGFTAVYTNLVTFQTYTFNIPATGNGVLGCIPAGSYSLNISKPGNLAILGFETGCSIISGTSAFFRKGVQVGPPGNCNSVILNYPY